MKKFLLLFLLALPMVGYSESDSINSFQIGFRSYFGYGPEHGYPLMGFPGFGLNAILYDTLEISVMGNLINTLGSFRSFGTGLAVYFPFSLMKVSYARSYSGMTQTTNEWESINMSAGMNLNLGPVYLQILGGPSLSFNIQNLEYFNERFAHINGTNFNLEIGVVMLKGPVDW